MITIEKVGNGFILTLIEKEPMGYAGRIPFGEKISEDRRVYQTQEEMLKMVKQLTE